MDPVTAVSAASEAWKIGGIAAVLLLILVSGGWLMYRFFVQLVRTLGERLNAVEDRQVKELTEVISQNTEAFHGLKHSNAEIIAAMRARPCLIETGVMHKPRMPEVPQ